MSSSIVQIHSLYAMQDIIVASVAFSIGCILQMWLLIRDKEPFKDLRYLVLLFAGCSVAGIVLSTLQSAPKTGILVAALFFTVIVYGLHQKRILPLVNERILLQQTLVTSYMLLVSQLISPFFLWPTMLALAIATIVAFVPRELPKVMRFCGYLWFVAMNIMLIGFQFSAGNILVFSEYKTVDFSIFGMLITGMLSVLVLTQIMTLAVLSPLPGKHQTWAERKKELAKQYYLITQKYSNVQLLPLQALLVIVIQGGILLLNYWLNILPHLIVIDVSWVLAETLTLVKNRRNFINNHRQ